MSPIGRCTKHVQCLLGICGLTINIDCTYILITFMILKAPLPLAYPKSLQINFYFWKIHRHVKYKPEIVTCVLSSISLWIFWWEYVLLQTLWERGFQRHFPASFWISRLSSHKNSCNTVTFSLYQIWNFASKIDSLIYLHLYFYKKINILVVKNMKQIHVTNYIKALVIHYLVHFLCVNFNQ